jgi:hypothetical protein
MPPLLWPRCNEIIVPATEPRISIYVKPGVLLALRHRGGDTFIHSPFSNPEAAVRKCPAAFSMAAAQRKRPQCGEQPRPSSLGLCREAARQDSLNLKSGHHSSESSGRIYGKASTFAGRRILIEPPPLDPHRAGFFTRLRPRLCLSMFFSLRERSADHRPSFPISNAQRPKVVACPFQTKFQRGTAGSDILDGRSDKAGAPFSCIECGR